MEQKKDVKLIIKFTDDAFDKGKESADLEKRKPYTKRVVETNRMAEALDRYDEFATLSLASSDYAQKDGGEYGIKKERYHEGEERLLPHQVLATEAFLRELRGFGLLADVVGSGKTYEACSVLSELCAKGKIASMLLVVPSQVYNTWIGVLEMGFGLGKGILKTVEDTPDASLFQKGKDGLLRPICPLIVKSEDFVKWKENALLDVLFDVVIVDEAHNLCVEEGESAKALKLLSILMMTKKRAEKTYCVLLSATPHSGNLENMFRLWYFIRCKGGLPEDFDEKEDKDRTQEYREEKRYYRERICRGATTVMEFISNVKMVEVAVTFRREFTAFLKKNGIADYDKMLEGEKKKLADRFLEENEEIEQKVSDNIANAYHHGVLRSIMIRQPNHRLRKGKRIENVFFFPLEGSVKTVTVKGLGGRKILVDLDALDGDNAISDEGKKLSLAAYIEQNRGMRSERAAYADLFFDKGIMHAAGLTDESFSKKHSLKFYRDELRSARRSADPNVTDDIHATFRPVRDKKVFEAKLAELKRILHKHKDSRVILFFDYDIKKSEKCHEDVLQALYADPAFADRVLIGDKTDKSITENKFNAKEDTVLVVTDNAFTEGANLQKSNVIVNFQVTPNPLAMEQRIGRIFRLGQENDVTIYSLADMTKLEGYVLMYFSCIGLMTSNSGDAAIIAGSNNDNMVTIRCDACGKVKLLSREDYDECVKNNAAEIYCKDFDKCRQFDKVNGTKMTVINSNEVKCTVCGNLIQRSNTGDGGQYFCMAGGGVMCSSGDPGDRNLYCGKICAIAHCKYFTEGPMQGKCAALNAYRKNPGVSEVDLEELCYSCENRDACRPECRMVGATGKKAIRACMTCEHATCSPKPHVLSFDHKWNAMCPICATRAAEGKLKPVVARTFETYIRSAYDYQQDGGATFCDNLLGESKKVSQIQQILSNDKVRS